MALPQGVKRSETRRRPSFRIRETRQALRVRVIPVQGDGPQWGGPGPAGWGPPPPPVPDPGGWNGGWEPNGGLCVFSLCIQDRRPNEVRKDRDDLCSASTPESTVVSTDRPL